MPADAKTSDALEIFMQAVDVSDDGERHAYLDRACGEQAELRLRVDQLLLAHFQKKENLLGAAEKGVGEVACSVKEQLVDIGETNLSNPEAMGISETDDKPIRGLIDVSLHPMIGHYKLLEELGHGGMGSVYMAQQTEPVKRKVALKVIKPGMDSKEVIARFEAERQALALMDHPNIAKVLDGGTIGDTGGTAGGKSASPSPASSDAGLGVRGFGLPYFVMELVRGMPITEFCKQKKLGLRDRLELFIDICKAVQHAHQKGIIHRDLKPSNLLVTMHDHLPVVKVIDFGVAKALNQELTERTLFTQYSQMVGTPLYMAPEQAQMSGLDVDTRSDIYSLGVILYELLTETTPFDKETMSGLGIDGIRKLIKEQEPQRPSARLSTMKVADEPTLDDQRTLDTEDIAQQLKRELDWIVMKALEKDRERRYDTATAFAADVQRYLNDEAVEACPPTVSYRLKKYAKKHKTWLTTAAILIVMLISSTAVSGLFAYQANEARIASEKSEQDAKDAQVEAEQKTVTANLFATAAKESAERAQLAERRERREKNLAQKTLYISDARLASEKVKTGSHSEALELLVNHSLERDENDRRSWEWYYILAQSHQSRLNWRAGTNSLWGIDWSPDGRQIATASFDGTCRVWDAESGEELKQIQTNDEGDGILLSVKWHPDGSHVAWGGSTDGGDLRIWNSLSDSTSRWHDKLGSVWDLAWNSDGTKILLGSIPEFNKLNLVLWEKIGADWEIRARASTSNNISSVGWNADENLVGVVVENVRTIIFDAETLQETQRFNQFNSRCLDWHPSEKSIIAGSTKSGELVVYDINNSEELLRFKPHIGAIRHFAWSPDGELLASAGRDGFVKIWDTSNWSLLYSFSGHSGIVDQVCWNPDSTEVASAGLDGVVNVWPLDRKNTHFQLVTASHKHGGNRVVWTSNNLLRTVNSDGEVVDLSPMTGAAESSTRINDSLRCGLVEENIAIQFGSDINVVSGISRISPLKNIALPIVENELKVTKIWGNRSGTNFAYKFNRARSKVVLSDWSRQQPIQLGDELIWGVRDVAWTPDETKISVVGSGLESADGYSAHAGWLHVFDAENGDPIARRRIGSKRMRGTAGTWSPDSKRIVCATEDGLCEVQEFETEQLFVSRHIHRLSVNSLDWHPEDSRIASGSTDQSVAVWDAETGDVLLRFPVGEAVQYVEWSPDGRMLAAKGTSGTVHVWNASEGYRYGESQGFANRLANRTFDSFSMAIRNREYGTVAKISLQMIEQEKDWGYRFIYLGALTSAYTGNLDSFQSLCRQMLSRYQDADLTAENHFTAWTCALAPDALDDYEPAIKLARHAVEQDSDNQQYLDGLGAILMRAGKYDEAKEQLEKALIAGEDDNTSPSYIHYFLSMSQHHLGNAEAAKDHLTKANDSADKELKGSPAWNRKLTLELLRKEAETLIDADEEQANSDDKPEND